MDDGNVHYGVNGKQAGTSRPGFFAKEVYHDEENERYISSYEGLAGNVYFDSGTPIGVSHPSLSGTEYISLDAENESDGAYFDEDTSPEEIDPQEFSEFECSNQRTIIANILVFAACFFIVGILILIFK